jgi:Zn-dependent protease
MKKSLKIGSAFGIGIYLHWSFLLLVVGIVVFFVVQSGPTASALTSIGVVLGVFACVVLHEFGHALTARRFDVPTRSITLYPIGGLARLERIPSDPMKEFWIAIAGPAVNVVIALGLGAVVLATGGPMSPQVLNEPMQDPLPTLVWLNVGLAVFNLLPAFPMDGGRVLRALLAMRRDYAQATQTAANIGQGMAILFGLLGVLSFNPILLFIALFVYAGAQRESQQAMFRSFTHGATVRHAMMTRFTTLEADDTLDDAIDALLAGSDHDFPIVEPDEDGRPRLTGILRRQTLIQALSQHDASDPVGPIAGDPCFTVTDDEMLEDVFIKMNEESCSTVPVLNAGELVGLLTLENVGELVMVASALERREASQVRDDLAPKSAARDE